MIARRAMMGLLGASSGGGGDVTDRLVLVHEERLGHLQTTNTSNTNTGVTITLELADISNYDFLIYLIESDTPLPYYHLATIRIIAMAGTSDIHNKNDAMALNSTVMMTNSAGNAFSKRLGSTSYGVFPNNATISDGTLSSRIYMCYNSNNSGNINGNYTCRIYGINLYDLIGG